MPSCTQQGTPSAAKSCRQPSPSSPASFKHCSAVAPRLGNRHSLPLGHRYPWPLFLLLNTEGLPLVNPRLYTGYRRCLDTILDTAVYCSCNVTPPACDATLLSCLIPCLLGTSDPRSVALWVASTPCVCLQACCTFNQQSAAAAPCVLTLLTSQCAGSQLPAQQH